MHSNNFPEDVKLVIHAHGQNKSGHVRKYKIPKASELADFIVGVQHG